jgi:DNA-binding response OmpR family regulator
MGNVVLVSGDPKTHAAIKALLPKGAALEEFATLDELPRPRTASAEGKYDDSVVVVDLSSSPPFAARLEPFRLAGIPLLALIDSPEGREAAFRAGFDDYLLRPCAPSELKARLECFARARGSGLRLPAAALERERQAAIGRLTSYFCHAVNNSMQTIRGSIDLAREEPGLTAGIAEYLTICRKETELIGAKIGRLRQVYRPKPQPPEAVQLDSLLRETLKMATDDLLRNNVTVREKIESPLPAVHCSADRVTLAFLMTLFHLGAELGARGGGELRIRTGREHGSVLLAFDCLPGEGAAGEAEAAGPLPPGLEVAQELIRSERGQMTPLRCEGGPCMQIRFPAGGR